MERAKTPIDWWEYYYNEGLDQLTKFDERNQGHSRYLNGQDLEDSCAASPQGKNRTTSGPRNPRMDPLSSLEATPDAIQGNATDKFELETERRNSYSVPRPTTGPPGRRPPRPLRPGPPWAGAQRRTSAKRKGIRKVTGNPSPRVREAAEVFVSSAVHLVWTIVQWVWFSIPVQRRHAWTRSLGTTGGSPRRFRLFNRCCRQNNRMAEIGLVLVLLCLVLPAVRGSIGDAHTREMDGGVEKDASSTGDQDNDNKKAGPFTFTVHVKASKVSAEKNLPEEEHSTQKHFTQEEDRATTEQQRQQQRGGDGRGRQRGVPRSPAGLAEYEGWTLKDLEIAEDKARNPMLEDEEMADQPNPGGKGSVPGMTSDELAFSAYDCSEQANMEVLTVAPIDDCSEQDRQKPIQSKKLRTYRLLQKANTFSFPVVECEVHRTRVAVTCGTYGHSHVATPLYQFNQPIPVTRAQCKDMYEKGYYAPARQGREKERHYYNINITVAVNTTTRAHRGAAGYVYNWGGSLECEGMTVDDWTGDKDKPLDRAVIAEYYEVSLHQREAFVNEDDLVVVHHNQMALPCKLKTAGCGIRDGPLYYWTVPEDEDRCPFYKVRDLQGITTARMTSTVDPADPYEEDLGMLFLSQDKSMMRLELQSAATAIPKCDSLVLKTQHPNLYVTLDLDNPLFQRQLHPREFDIFTYVDAQDDYTYNVVKEGLTELVQEWRNTECQRRKRHQQTAFARRAAEQHAVVDGQTAALGNGRFITAAGEVYHSYYCRPVVAFLSLEPGVHRCFDALPVTLSEADMDRRRIALGQPNSVHTVFMEPHTRRLVDTAAEIECEHPQNPIYRNNRGNYVAYKGNTAHLTPAPKVLERSVFETTGPLLPELDFSAGGTYELKDRQRLQRYQQAPRITYAMARRAGNRAWGAGWDGRGPEPPATYLPGIPVHELGFMNLWNQIYDFLHTYGELCSVLVGTGLIIQGVVWFFSVLLRLYATPLTPNICLHILAAFCPALGDYLMRGSHWENYGGPCGAIGQLCACCRPVRYQPPAGQHQGPHGVHVQEMHVFEPTDEPRPGQPASAPTHERIEPI